MKVHTSVSGLHLQLFSDLANEKGAVLGENLDDQVNQHVRVELRRKTMQRAKYNRNI